ncbi:MAG: class I SAM-dependent methyltransferase [Halanaeroarchaeum sp.]
MPVTVHDVPFFDRVAPLYDLVLPETDAAPLREGLGHAERVVEDVVDLGGGTGRAARALDHEPVVLDASEGMLAKARRYDLEGVRGDVRQLPFPDDAVDAVVSVDAVHHFPAVPDVIREVERVLAVGGALAVREFDPSTLRGRGLVWGEHRFGFESTFFTVAELVEQFEAAGLETTVLERGFVYTVVGVKPGDQ